jgi:hypothetical protein
MALEIFRSGFGIGGAMRSRSAIHPRLRAGAPVGFVSATIRCACL